VADGPGFLAGAAVGALWGGIAGYLAGDRQQAAFLDAKNAYAEQLKNVTTNYLGLADAAAGNQINNYNMSMLFFARKAEWAALQLYNEQKAKGEAHIFDLYYVLSEPRWLTAPWQRNGPSPPSTRRFLISTLT
jgi:hypothetical protein